MPILIYFFFLFEEFYYFNKVGNFQEKVSVMAYEQNIWLMMRNRLNNLYSKFVL